MKSTVGKVSAIMVLVAFILASALVLNVALAQNNSNEMKITGLMLLNNISANKNVDSNNLKASIDANATNETDVLENATNETEDNRNISTGFVLGESLVLDDSVTVTLISNEAETTDDETSQENDEISQETPEKPTFDVQLVYPQRITRGEVIDIQAVLTSDMFAKNIYLKWLLPIGFEIISGNAIETCGNLNNTICISNISVITDNAGTGLGKIRVVVDYEE